MPINQVLTAIGLIRPARRRGFCPACRWFGASEDEGSAASTSEIAPPAVAALAVLALAAIAWVAMARQAASMDGMGMGLGPLPSFAATWLVMMAAMMLPSAVPLVTGFVRGAEGRRLRALSTAVLVSTYLCVWLVFGIAAYLIYGLAGMPRPHENLIGAAALVLAGAYSLTPLKRASQARCRELCALHGPLPFNLVRSALVAGARYGLSCLGCSAALMVAMLVIGMSNFWWAVILAAAVTVYKFSPELRLRHEVVLSLALMGLGIAYAIVA